MHLVFKCTQYKRENIEREIEREGEIDRTENTHEYNTSSRAIFKKLGNIRAEQKNEGMRATVNFSSVVIFCDG